MGEIAKAGVAPENLELLKIALKTAELAEENILKFYQNDVGVEWKADMKYSPFSSGRLIDSISNVA